MGVVALDPDIRGAGVVVAGAKLMMELYITEEGIAEIMLHVALEALGLTITLFCAPK